MVENTTNVLENAIEEVATNNTKSGKGAGLIILGLGLAVTAALTVAACIKNKKDKSADENEGVVDGDFVDEDDYEEVDSDDDAE